MKYGTGREKEYKVMTGKFKECYNIRKKYCLANIVKYVNTILAKYHGSNQPWELHVAGCFHILPWK